MLVFVYGSLRKGMINEDILRGCQFVGEYTTPPVWKMYDLGLYPACVQGGDTAIVGEVYRIDKRDLIELDNLEGYPDLYHRKKIITEYGKAWMYFIKSAHLDADRVPSGDWVKHGQVF